MDRLASYIARCAGVCFLLIGMSAFAAVPIDRVKVDLDALIRSAARSPTQIAVPVDHRVSAGTAGVWTEVNGRSTWRYTVQIPTAVSLSFHATRVTLPPSATLRVSGKSGTAIYRRANLHKGELWSRIATGDVLSFALDVAPADRSRVILEIATFQAGYRGLGRLVRDHPAFRRMKAQAAINSNQSCVQNYDCNVTSANTPAGQATVGLLIENLYLCSGTVINDVRQDSIPYVLTARHCQTGELGGGNPGVANAVSVYWNAISACGQPLGTFYDPDIANQVGATTIVEQQDTWLIRLDSNPVVTDAYFAGFDARGRGVQGGYTVHHALGFDKQFTLWYGRPAAIHEADVLGVTYVSDFLETVNKLGNIGPGASGSGLFDQRDNLVGTLSLGRTTHDASEYGACPSSNPQAPDGFNGVADFTTLAAIWDSTADATSSTGSRTLKSVLDPGDTGVRVVASAAVPSISFAASEDSVSPGDTVELTWNTPGATKCTASGGNAGDGWGGVVGASGTQSVSEADGRLMGYRLVCSLAGKRSVSALVHVSWGSPSPQVTFIAREVAWTGAANKLTWNSNAAPCSLVGGNLALFNLPASGSRFTIQETPAQVAYTIKCGPPDNYAISGAFVFYQPPSVEFHANGTDRLLGEQFFLEWQSAAAQCTHTGGAPNDGWSTFNFPDFPSWTFTPDVSTTGTYTYTLTCTTGALTIEKSVVVTIEDNLAPYVDVSIDRTSVPYAVEPPNLFTLNWKSNLSQCDPHSEPDIGQFFSNLYPEDTAVVAPRAPGHYTITLTCWRSNWNDNIVSAPIEVTVLPPAPPTATISIEPDHVEVGEFFTVRWSSTNTKMCTGTGGTPDGIWDPVYPSSYQTGVSSTPGQFTFAISCSSIADGIPDAQAEAMVTVAGPPMSATLTANTRDVVKGQSFTLTWSSTGATGCTASGGGASGSEWAGSLAPSGSTTEEASNTGSFTYRLSCTNGAQAARSRTTVKVSESEKSGSGGGGRLDIPLLTALALSLVLCFRRRNGPQSKSGDQIR